MTRADAPPTALIGRDTESRALIERIDAARAGNGGALVIRGAPGIGKTSLLETARMYATNAGVAILRTTGVQSETHLPFAGLHLLLKPVLNDIDRLPEPYSKALQSAFGLSEEPVTSPHLVAMAMLHLLGESAERIPVLLLVDDAQWLDGSTVGALSFVARRLESDPILLVTAFRDGFENPFLEAGTPELAIAALTDVHSEALLNTRAPWLDRGLRGRVLESAAGNPLALVELSTALRSSAEADRLFWGSDLPLTTRLERAFADRLASLSPGTRSFLHVAAANERGMVAELLAATSALAGREITLEVATEARDAGLVEVDGPELRFRHPLMRSAIHHAMSLEERQATHAALAATLERDPDRCAWHRAAATVGTDAGLVSELDAIAQRAYRRGALAVTIEATDRAARFAEDPRQRATLLARAAAFAWMMGRATNVHRLLDAIVDEHLAAWDRPHVAFLRETYGRGPKPEATQIAQDVAAAEQLRAEGQVARALALLGSIAAGAWWSNPDEVVRTLMVSAVSGFDVPEDEPRVLFTLAMASPIEHGQIVLDRLTRRTVEPTTDMRGETRALAEAAQAVGDFVRSEPLMDRQIAYCRSQGVLGGLVPSLVKQSWTKIQRGDLRNAGSMATEAVRLAEETGQQTWLAAANLTAATIAAYRGEIDVAERLTHAGERLLPPLGADPHLAMVQWPRGVAALAAGRHDEAYQQLSRIFEPSDIAYHPHVRNWVLVDLVEAAVHSGHEVEAARWVGELESIVARSRSPQLEGALQYARLVLSPDSNQAAFQADAGLAIWPFTRARLQLAYGVWLRRQRRPADSRTPLRVARDAFDALGALPWGQRARQELRASGETSRRRSYDLTDALSPQEHQIAQLAAQGLSNKEIGQQLFLSHRTISTHLYRIFPKLGITARSHLSAALQSRSTAQAS